MAGKSDIQAGRAFVELYVKNSRLLKGLAAAKQRLRDWGTGLSTLGKWMIGLGTAAVAPILAATKHFMSAGDQLNKMAARTGIGTAALSELGFAAEQSGQNIEVIEASVKKMQKTIGDAARGTQTAVEVFELLGIPLAELLRLSPDQQFERIAEGLANIPDPTLRAARAMDIFGRSGTALLPMMAQGAAGIHALREEAKELGLSIGDKEAQSAADLVDAWNRVKRAAGAAIFAVGSSVASGFTEALGVIKGLVVATGNWVRENRDMAFTLLKIGATAILFGVGLLAAGTAIIGLGLTLGSLGIIATYVASAVAGAVAMIGSVIGVLLSPIALATYAVIGLGAALLRVARPGAITQGLASIGQTFQDVFGYLRNLASSFSRDFSQTWRGIVDAIAAGDLSLAARVAWAGLQVVWQRGTAEVNKLWEGAKWYFLAVWHEATFSMARFFTSAWASIQRNWVQTVAFLQSVWDGFATAIANGWNKAQQGAGNLLINAAESAGIVGKEFADAWRDNLNKPLEAKIATRTDDSEKRQQEISRQESRQLGAIDDQEQGALGNLSDKEKQAYYDQINAKYKKDLEEKEAALRQAQDELTAAQSEAMAKRAVVDAKNAGKPDLFQKLADISHQVGVAGTFNPYAIPGMGTGSVADKQLTEARTTNQMLRKQEKDNERMLRQLAALRGINLK